MKKSTKIWLVVAGSLILIGLVLFGGIMSTLNWNFLSLSTDPLTNHIHAFPSDIDSISISTDVADIVIRPLDDDGEPKVVYFVRVNASHSVKIENGTLRIEIKDERKWYQHIGINFTSPKITVYLPQKQYQTLTIHQSTGDIKIAEGFQFESILLSVSTGDIDCRASALSLLQAKTSSGDVHIEGVTAGTMGISTTTGDSRIINVTCNNMTSKGTTGDILMKNVMISGSLFVKRNTGDVTLSSCDAADIAIETTTGSVKGSLLSEKTFNTSTTTGKISVPEAMTGDPCRIKTTTGNISIKIEKAMSH